MEAASAPRATGYPFGVVIVLVGIVIRIVVILAGLLAGAASGPLAWLADAAPIPDYPPDTAVGVVTRVVSIALLIASLLAIAGLLRRSRSGWVLAVITGGTILALDLGWWASGEPRYLSMAMNAVLVFYLNQRDVRTCFDDPV